MARNIPEFIQISTRPLRDISLRDRFFDSLRDEYAEFDDWYQRVANEGRSAWVVSGAFLNLAALCIFKVEKEGDLINDSGDTLPGTFLKLCTFKVAETGIRYGERLLFAAFTYAVELGFSAVYVQVRVGRHKELVDLLENFGFVRRGKYKDDFSYVKYMTPGQVPEGLVTPWQALHYAIRYYPYFLDGNNIRKFVVSLSPQEYDLLFPDAYCKSLTYPLLSRPLVGEVHAISKHVAKNVGHSCIRRGDLLFFYQKSGGRNSSRGIECMGFVEKRERYNAISQIPDETMSRLYNSSGELKRLIKDTGYVLIIHFRLVTYLAAHITRKELNEFNFELNHRDVRRVPDLAYRRLLKPAARFGVSGAKDDEVAPSDISVVILQKNEKRHIRRCLENLARLKPEQIFIVDCSSDDGSDKIASKLGALVVQHEWPSNQAAQFQWALANLNIHTKWILRLDADEYLTEALADEIRDELPIIDDDVNGVVLKRRCVVGWLGDKWVKRGMYPTRILRLFRTGHGRSDIKIMDEHIIVDGRVVEFEHDFVDHSLISFEEWKEMHRNYARREAECYLSGERSSGEKAAKKDAYYKLPPYFRAVAYFCIRYFVKLGFLDGLAGFRWHFWQGLWYRWLVDREIGKMKSGN